VIAYTRFARDNVIIRFFYIFVFLIFKVLNILQFLSNSSYVLISYSFIIFFSIIAFAFAAFVNFIIINLYIFFNSCADFGYIIL